MGKSSRVQLEKRGPKVVDSNGRKVTDDKAVRAEGVRPSSSEVAGGVPSAQGSQLDGSVVVNGRHPDSTPPQPAEETKPTNPDRSTRQRGGATGAIVALSLAIALGALGFVIRFFWIGAIILMAIAWGLMLTEAKSHRSNRGIMSEVVATVISEVHNVTESIQDLRSDPSDGTQDEASDASPSDTSDGTQDEAADGSQEKTSDGTEMRHETQEETSDVAQSEPSDGAEPSDGPRRTQVVPDSRAESPGPNRATEKESTSDDAEVPGSVGTSSEGDGDVKPDTVLSTAELPPLQRTGWLC
jgi:hypothetical protein